MPENIEILHTPGIPEILIPENVKETEVAVQEEPSYDINKFRLTRILQNNTQRKSVALLGKFPDISETNQAIILFEKQAFRESDVQTEIQPQPERAQETKDTQVDEEQSATPKPSYFNNGLTVQTEFINNIYGSFQCLPSAAELSGIKTTVIYPATEKHIDKHSITQKYLISETSTLYENITLPYLISSQLTLDWVYNILEHKQESERILYEDNDPQIGFILLPDLKWDGRNIDTLYLLAITHKRDIKSLRDLCADHLPLLRNIRTRSAQAIEQRYGLKENQLRMYFHYQPSFYHLHVHINPLRMDAPGISCDKSHMLDAVISNLELLSDYYQRATIPFVLHGGNKLLELYEAELESIKRHKRPITEVDE